MKRFNAIIKGDTIGNGTRADLRHWLEKFVQIYFFDNGIEWWSEHDGDMPVGQFGGKDGIANFACYVRKCRNEGRIIEVLALYRDNTFKTLISAKSFGSESECSLIAGALAQALESIYQFEEIPLIVSMVASVPMRHWWQRPAVLTAPLIITRASTSVEVTAGGKTVWSHKVDNQERAKYDINAVMTDWRTILSSLQITAVEIEVTDDVAMDV